MATTLNVVSLSPSRAFFDLSSNDATLVSFMKSGAMGADKDLASLNPGPLKTYLDRLPDWGVLVQAGLWPKVRWRFMLGGSYTEFSGGYNGGGTDAYAMGPMLIQNGATSLGFLPFGPPGTLVYVELAFIHSLQR